jgi:hydroxyacylglutathione hydrolase
LKEIVPDVFMLRGFPPAAFNVYVIRSEGGWVLVDTSTRHARRRILRQLPGKLEAIFITHAHRDHAGSMHAIAVETGAPVWASAVDTDALEGKAPEPVPAQHKDHIVNRLFSSWWRDRHPVARRLAEDDLVAGFTVVEFAGHTPGQIGLWRESDRTVLCADTMRNINLYTGIPQLGEVPEIFTVDLMESHRSIRKLAAMEPRTVGFGHGWPLKRNAAQRLIDFAAELPLEAPPPP